MFFKGSRYEDVETVSLSDVRGQIVRYKAIRFIPATAPLHGWAVEAGDRLDNVAYEAFRQPQRFWRICDANTTMWPSSLVERPGRVIAIPSAAG